MKLLTKIRHLKRFSVQIFFNLSLAILLFLNSCSSLRSFDIQVSKKEQFPLPDNIQSIAILNHAFKQGFTNLITDSLERLWVSKKFAMDTVFCDSLAADTAIQIVAQLLYESGRYDVVIPLQRNISRNDTAFLDQALPTAFITEICHDFNTDAVLVLESFNERLLTTYRSIPHSEQPATKEKMICVVYNTIWRIYEPFENSRIKRYDISDTIFWKSYGLLSLDIDGNLPFLKKALIIGGINSSNRLARYISPAWVNQSRKYYKTGNKQIDKAIPLIQNNKWDEAAAIWHNFSTVTSKTIKSKVEFNLALASEINGDFDLAIDWGLKSFKTKYSKVKEVYLRTLDQRRKELELDEGKMAF